MCGECFQRHHPVALCKNTKTVNQSGAEMKTVCVEVQNQTELSVCAERRNASDLLRVGLSQLYPRVVAEINT